MSIFESLTGMLINNPRAAYYYNALPANASATECADKYCQLATHSDAESEAACLALETHVRTVASMHFHVAAVNDALARVEDAKAQAKKRKAAARRSAARRRVNAKKRARHV